MGYNFEDAILQMYISTLKTGDPVLFEKTEFIKDFNPKELKKLVSRLIKFKEKYNGVGAAASQIGIALPVIVHDVLSEDKSEVLETSYKINPRVLLSSSAESEDKEGCLSIPMTLATISRPDMIKIAWEDVTGKTHTGTFTGFNARILQHEIDHTNGILILHRVKSMDDLEVNGT